MDNLIQVPYLVPTNIRRGQTGAWDLYTPVVFCYPQILGVGKLEPGICIPLLYSVTHKY